MPSENCRALRRPAAVQRHEFMDRFAPPIGVVRFGILPVRPARGRLTTIRAGRKLQTSHVQPGRSCYRVAGVETAALRGHFSGGAGA